MIESGLAYFLILVLISLMVVLTEKTTRSKLFSYLPSIVILYFTVMLLSTLGVWQKTPEITATYKTLKSNLLPAMIFLLLLSANIRHIAKLGKKMILTFLLASTSIGMGFIAMFALLHTFFETDSWRAFAALSGSWMGGTGNMVAIQGALDVPDSKMGYALLIDSIDYAIWVMILLALVPFANRFNHWTKSDTALIDEVGEKLSINASEKKPAFMSILTLISAALLISVTSQWIAALLPTTTFVTQTTWVVLIATVAGIVLAMTPLAKMAGSMLLGNMLLYLLVALIASRANFSELTQAPLYILAGFIIIFIHAAVMVFFAKLFKLDLFSLGVASLANIGGVASAPILASAYSKALIPIGILMAMMGYILGTFGGLMVGKVLEMIST